MKSSETSAFSNPCNLSKLITTSALQTLRRPRRYLSRLGLFFGFVFLFHASGSGGLFRRLSSSTDGFKFISLRKGLAEFIYPDIANNVGSVEDRKLMWKKVNKSLSDVREKRFPDAFVVGAERCGARAMANLLSFHPLIKQTRPFENQFFTKHFSKGKEFYMEMMPMVSEKEVVLEFSETYFSLAPMAIPKRIKDVSPKAKIIVVLCNPADRVVVDFNAEMQGRKKFTGQRYELFLGTYLKKVDKLTEGIPYGVDTQVQSRMFSMMQKDIVNHVLLTGLYYYHALRYKEVFRASQILYLDREDVLKTPAKVMLNLQQFLEVPPLIQKDDIVFDKASNSFCFEPSWGASKKHCPFEKEANVDTFQPATCLESLKKFYHPYNLKLCHLLKRDFHW